MFFTSASGFGAQSLHFLPCFAEDISPSGDRYKDTSPLLEGVKYNGDKGKS